MELPAELEAAIRAAPDDRAGYLVAADWLTGQGDPHGELIALSLAPPSADVERRIGELQRQLAPVDTSDPWAPIRLEWRWGFVVGVAASSLAARATLLTLLRSPIARFLRKLVLSEIASRLVDALIAEPRALASLRTLALHIENDEPLDLAPVWRAAPAVERLVLHAVPQLAPIALPRLRELTVGRPQTGALAWSELPLLETMRLRLGPETVDWLEPSRFPALRRLTLAGEYVGDTSRWESARIADQLVLFDVMAVRRGVWGQRSFVVDKSQPAPSAMLLMTGTLSTPAGTLFPLPNKRRLAVGRRKDADIRLVDSTVSRMHGHLFQSMGRWDVQELPNDNGTYVNGQHVERCPLRPGDEVSFGRVELRFLAGDIEAQADALRERFGLGV